jgi:amino acid transporter
MEKTDKSIIKRSTRSVQDYLSLGYVFLLVLGIIRDSIYYGLLGINFLRYSNILDVLLSPISYMTENLRVPIFLTAIFFVAMGLFTLRARWHEKNKHKDWYKKRFNVEKIDEAMKKSSSLDTTLFVLALVVFSFFTGTGVGGGIKQSDIIENKEVKPNHNLYFFSNPEQAVPVYIIGQNTQFIFYAVEDSDEVNIVPIQGNVARIVKKTKKNK